ncbi:hypothetical protein C4J97_3051 [Pseudomonas orientalis]|nr:hypothetical protein C4J97_3051 [Pseudomonas orientalis]
MAFAGGCQDQGGSLYRMHEAFGLNTIKLWEGACSRWRRISHYPFT